MDYEKLIEENECLKTYFTDFPKKLMQLAIEGKVIKFSSNGILINYEILHNYLLSEESAFPECSLLDFFETLHVLQFSRVSHPKKATTIGNKIFYNFINPNFSLGALIADDFYQQPIDITSVHLFKGTKRMTNIHHIGLFQRLIDRSCTQEVLLSRLEFARMRIDYEFQRRTSLMSMEEDVIEHDINEPQFYKDNEIAGYYGNVEFSDLKNGFCNYFPIYQDEADVVQEETVESYQIYEIKMENESNQTSIVHYEQVPIMNDEAAEVPVEENKRKRKRKPYTKRSAKITKKETEDAVSNLQNQFGSNDNF